MKKWKVVFWIAAAIFALQIINIPLSNNPGLADAIGLLISGFSLMPLYGFAYKVAIGSQNIARAILFINCILIVPSIYSAIMFTTANISIAQFIFTTLAMCFILIFFYPMYAYAFKCNEIWQHNA